MTTEIDQAYNQMYAKVKSFSTDELRAIWEAIKNTRYMQPDMGEWVNGHRVIYPFDDWANAIYSELELREAK